MTGPVVGLCSTYDLEVFPWWHDLAVKIFPVLLINSNRLVKFQIPILPATYATKLPFLHKLIQLNETVTKRQTEHSQVLK